MSMDYSKSSSRSSSKINENLLMGIGTEVIYLVPDSVGFDTNYQNLISYEDRALTDTSNNKVSLTLPLDTSLKIYAYRYTENFTLNDLESLSKKPVSYGKSGSFIVSESTSSLTISLSITPNGIPGLDVGTSSVSINNQGGSATFTLKLVTQPKETVTVPISIDNTSIAILSSSSLSFTPLDWNTLQTVTLTGNSNTNYSDNVTLMTSLGPSVSEDGDYTGLSENFTLSSTSYPQTPTNVTATADNASVVLNWDSSASATGYSVYYDNTSGITSSDTVISGISIDNYTLLNLQNGTTYHFRVASVNSNGESALSSEVSATPLETLANPQTPANLTATADNASVVLEWDSSASATGYSVYYDNSSGVSVSDTVISGISNDNYTLSNLTNGTTYYFKVASVNTKGTSVLSTEVSATPSASSSNDNDSTDNDSTDNLSSGLIAFYRFNGNANDNTSNENHGTVSGATLTKGKDNVSNTAYSFDGTDDYIEFPAGLLSGSGDFSVSLWVKTSSTTESRILQQRDSNGYNGEYMLNLKSNGKLKLETYKNGYKWGGTTTTSINDSNWHHICFIQKDNGGSLYLDGTIEISDNSSGTVNMLSSLKTYLGGDKRDNNRFYSGNVDKLRLYNRALSTSEITTLYSSDNTTSLGEWAHWKLDDSSGSDNVSSRDLSVIGTPSIDNSTWSLTGNGTYGEYQLNTNDNLDNFSLSLRFKIKSNAGVHESIISSDKNKPNGSWQIGMTGNTSIKFSSKQSSGDSSSKDLLLLKDTWHHLVLTKSNSNQVRIYTNNSLSETLQLNNWALNWLRIGTNRNTANFWKGNIDDVRIYDYVLSEDNINTLYQKY